MKTRWVYVVLVGVFVLGAIAGGGAALAYAQSEHATAATEGKVPHRRLRALTRKLDLDRDQQNQVASILADDEDQSRTIGHEVVERCGQRLRDHKTHVDDEIRTVLRPDQRRRFERIVERRR